jgi:type IV pilus assembly protein PilC
MAEFLLKYADSRGQIHQQVAEAASEQELRERLTEQGYLVYWVRPRASVETLTRGFRRPKRINLEKFLIFNQQFVTLIRAGLPILKALDLLSKRTTDPKLGRWIQAVRDEVRNGALLSEAFRRQGVFPPVYISSILAGEKSGSLTEVLDRYISYQKLALAVRKKLLVSLIYPSFLVFLVCCLVVFLVTYVVPNFAQLYESMQAELPRITQILIAVGTTARAYVVAGFLALVAAILAFRLWAARESSKETLDRLKLRLPLAGEIWIKYQVAQLARVLSTLLTGGIPLVQAMQTAAESLGSSLLRKALASAEKLVREGQPLSAALRSTTLFPELATDMIEVGESTGALPAMLNSVAEFYEDDVSTSLTAALSLIEPAIMIGMGVFVAFVLVALYLPIFSLADTLR